MGLANDWKDEYAYIYFISSFDYHKLMINILSTAALISLSQL